MDPVGGGVNSPGGGHQHTNLPDFPKNCMKLRKVWSVVEPGAPPWIHNWGGCGAVGGGCWSGGWCCQGEVVLSRYGGGAVHNSK